MQKIMLLFVLCFCACFALPCQSADASANNVSVYLLKEWAAEKYGCKIDEDGDLILNGSEGTICVSVKRKANLIRLFSPFAAYKKRSITEMKSLANKFNADKRFLRISILPNGSSVCDYYIIYDGGLNSVNFLEALDWFTGLKGDWVNYVINGGDDK